MAYTIKDLNRDLNRDLQNHEVKERKTFHRGTDVHGKVGKSKNRHDRRKARLDLRRGEW